MCSYRERKADPTEILQLDGFTVDYCEPIEGSFSIEYLFFSNEYSHEPSSCDASVDGGST